MTAKPADEDVVEMIIVEAEAAAETVDVVAVNDDAVYTPFDTAIDEADVDDAVIDGVVVEVFPDGLLKAFLFLV
ncbi:hypothetical protein NDU88_005585 [Pleurodeles waltl]|uniref:Uncharacterized protein n=1 Tax=Pleurodeles waltl TaxID=8319 RepID=A0AAV7QJA7_PLEWA|nr:hypothetical protein NDU88_005585 [Pleurodeles waltl]